MLSWVCLCPCCEKDGYSLQEHDHCSQSISGPPPFSLMAGACRKQGGGQPQVSSDLEIIV